MSPLDLTQFVEQLATFSALEQQVRSNVSLESIATMIYDMGSLIAGQWLGKTVSFESSRSPIPDPTSSFQPIFRPARTIAH